MRVLFPGAGEPNPESGGAYTFHTSVRAAFEKLEQDRHKLIFNDMLQPNVDFTWFLGPSPAFAQCTTPFAFTVWDLGHRMHPYFPEVMFSGWRWESRQKRYMEAVPRASIVSIGSKEGARQLRYFHHPCNVLVNPLPVSPVFQGEGDPTILAKHNLTFSKYLLYPAQFWPHKNHITIVDALKLLGPEYKAVFTGSDKGNETYVKEYVRSQGLADRVLFAGFVSVPELIALYRNAFATVYASAMGPDNLPPLEAMACGCPVVCAAYDGAEELGRAVLDFHPYNADGLAARVHQINDRFKRQDLIDTGASLVATRTADNYVNRIMETLDTFAKIRRLWGREFKHL